MAAIPKLNGCNPRVYPIIDIKQLKGLLPPTCLPQPKRPGVASFARNIRLNFLKSLFQTPQFPVGSRVNLLDGSKAIVAVGADTVDGRVVAQTEHGVLVEWPFVGTRWVNPRALCQQV